MRGDLGPPGTESRLCRGSSVGGSPVTCPWYRGERVCTRTCWPLSIPCRPRLSVQKVLRSVCTRRCLRASADLKRKTHGMMSGCVCFFLGPILHQPPPVLITGLPLTLTKNATRGKMQPADREQLNSSFYPKYLLLCPVLELSWATSPMGCT